MNPPNGWQIADSHVHFFSPAFFRSLAEQKKVPEVGSLLGWDIPDSSEALADRWIGEMDQRNVAHAVLIASIHGDSASVEVACSRYPTRFSSLCMVNPLLTNGPVDPRQGIFLFPAMHRYSLQDDRARAVIAAARLVYVHCGVLSVGFRKKLGLPCAFDMRFSNPIDLHAVALEFPHVNFVIPHFGAGYFREALMVADLCPNVYLDTSSSNNWLRFQPGRMALTDAFRNTLDAIGSKRILFGSDSSWFPRGWNHQVFDSQLQALSDAGASTEMIRDILGGNLLELLRPRNT